MSDYHFDLPVDTDKLQAIGMVAAEWSYLESVIDAAIWTRSGVPNDEVGEAMTTHLNIRTRVDMLSTLISLAGYDPEDEAAKADSEATKLLRAVHELASRRNKVVHARWVRGDLGSPLIYTVQARGTLKRTVEGIPSHEIINIAREISVLSMKLRALLGIFEAD